MQSQQHSELQMHLCGDEIDQGQNDGLGDRPLSKLLYLVVNLLFDDQL